MSNDSNCKFDIDYYGVLQLNKNCNDLDIKKARLAIHYNSARQKNENIQGFFCLIAEAYEVLSDPFKRAIYDQYGEAGLKRGVSGPNGHIPPYVFHGDPLWTFREFFGTLNPYGDLLNILTDSEVMRSIVEGHSCRRKEKPLIKSLGLTLTEIFFGALKKLKIEKFMFVDGEKINTILKEKILHVPIKPGLPTATEIVFTEEGDQGPNIIPADIIFVTEDIPHEIFKRQGDNLEMTVDIFLSDALIGTTVTVNTLDERIIRIPITSIITPDYRKCIVNEGLPLVKTPNIRGDLVINFNIEFPIYLSMANKYSIKKALDKHQNDNFNGEL
ncbi:hypothetical protein PV325_002997 [Microctonus aethiopoides]|uniref:J domain-containing protein n=1 Tax=Microctonus aethiopoides TaxID=144406 RepID=A0AA39CB44_9HYME|nr:hypothetical protein PV325_002997 [Microctonus aethiopoides]KAK0160805.1 hypothetical protein PV328_008173 [Microctonus aethiopoides]